MTKAYKTRNIAHASCVEQWKVELFFKCLTKNCFQLIYDMAFLEQFLSIIWILFNAISMIWGENEQFRFNSVLQIFQFYDFYSISFRNTFLQKVISGVLYEMCWKLSKNVSILRISKYEFEDWDKSIKTLVCAIWRAIQFWFSISKERLQNFWCCNSRVFKCRKSTIQMNIHDIMESLQNSDGAIKKIQKTKSKISPLWLRQCWANRKKERLTFKSCRYQRLISIDLRIISCIMTKSQK